MRSAPLLFLLLLFCSPLFSQESPTRPAITGIVYARIVVSNLDDASDFYAKKLGFGDVFTGCHGVDVPCVAVDGLQRIEFGDPKHSTSSNRLVQIAFATANISGLRSYLQVRGVKTSEIFRLDDDSAAFEITDPEGHPIAFVQRPEPHSTVQSKAQVSLRLIHAGFVVHDRVAEDRFYKDILGFHVYWHGGMKDDETNWVDMQVPDGTDWLEYMLNVPPNADKHTLGVMNHIALGVPDIHAAQQQLLKNGWKGTEQPKIGRDGKWQLNLYDPDDTRVELMEFTPVEKPCCSEYTGPHPKP